jgi:hypothetical protein
MDRSEQLYHPYSKWMEAENVRTMEAAAAVGAAGSGDSAGVSDVLAGTPVVTDSPHGCDPNRGPRVSGAADHDNVLTGPPGCIDAAARYLASEPAAVTRALTTHQTDRDGWCRGCDRTVRWPCAVDSIAQRAQALVTTRSAPR